MIAAIIILAYLLLTTWIVGIVYGIDAGLHADEWVATITFIICPLVWAAIKLFYKIHLKRKRAKALKARKDKEDKQ